jgi:hypothetical protein
MNSDPHEALMRWGNKETTVVLWRHDWTSDAFTFDTLREAVQFARADTTGPMEIQLQVHLDSADYSLKGEHLAALSRLVA